MGYGLRYEYGIFRQTIENGWQRGAARQLARDARIPWEVARPNEAVEVPLGCSFDDARGRACELHAGAALQR